MYPEAWTLRKHLVRAKVARTQVELCALIQSWPGEIRSVLMNHELFYGSRWTQDYQAHLWVGSGIRLPMQAQSDVRKLWKDTDEDQDALPGFGCRFPRSPQEPLLIRGEYEPDPVITRIDTQLYEKVGPAGDPTCISRKMTRSSTRNQLKLGCA